MNRLPFDDRYDVVGNPTAYVPTPPHQRRALNVPLSLISLAVVLILSVSVFFLYRYQMRRTVTSLLQRADECERAGKYVDATVYLQRYLSFVPHDHPTLARLATVSDKALIDSPNPHEHGRVVRLYLRAIGVAPASEVADLRKRLCELLFEQERFTLAARQASAILNDNPDDPDGWKLLALSLYGKAVFQSFSNVDSAEDDGLSLGGALERSLQLNPVDVKTAGLFADVLRQHPDLLSLEQKERVRSAAEKRLPPADVRLATLLPEINRLSAAQALKVRAAAVDLDREERAHRVLMADQVFDTMLAKAPSNALAWAARFDYRTAYDIPGGPADLKKALELAPLDPRLLLVAGQRELAQGKSCGGAEQRVHLSAAHKYFKEIIVTRDSPQFASSATERLPRAEHDAILRQAFIGLGQAAMSRGDLQLAVKWFRDGSEDVGKDDVRFKLYLADTLLTADRLDEATAELRRADAHLTEDSPLLRKNALRALRRSRAMVQGKLDLRRGRLVAAIREFKRIILGDEPNETSSELTFHALSLMGTAYAELEQWDLAGISFEQALSVRPDDSKIFQAAVLAWQKANQPQRLVDLYSEHLPEKEDIELWFDLARALLQVQDRLAPSERNWSAFENALSTARDAHSQQRDSEECRFLLLDIEHALARQSDLLTRAPEGQLLCALQTAEGGDLWPFYESHMAFLQELLPRLDVEQECQTLLNISPATSAKKTDHRTPQQLVRELCLAQLRMAKAQLPEDFPPTWRFCQLYERLGSPAEADAALIELEERQSSSLAPLLLRAQLLTNRGKSSEARTILKAALRPSATTDEEKILLEDAIIRLELQEGSKHNLDVARKLLVARQLDHPYDTNVIWRLAILALRRNEYREAESWTNKLRQLEGDDGVLSKHAEALQLLAKLDTHSTTGNSLHGRAHTLASQIVNQRPLWPAAWILRARLADQESRWKEAADAYKKALEFGSVELDVYRELIVVLFRMGELHDANRYLHRIRPAVGPSPSLSALAVSVSAKLGEKGRALTLARRRVDEDPNDPISWIWLSRTQLLNDLQVDAETSLRKARELAPSDARIAYAHFAFCVEKGQFAKARKLLQTICENSTFDSPSKRLIIEAQGHESLKDEVKAAELYKRAATMAPNDAKIQTRVASFFLARDVLLAETLMRRALALEPNSVSARRHLASLLMVKSTKQSWDEARELLGSNDNSELGQRLTAVLLLEHGLKNLDTAKEILQRLVAKSANDGDRFLLANAYLLESALHAEKAERTESLEQARTHYQFLASQENAKATHIRRFVDFLLRYQSREEAEKWLARLRSATLTASKVRIAGLLRHINYLMDAGFEELANEELDALESVPIDSSRSVHGAYVDLLLRKGDSDKAKRSLRVLLNTTSDSFSNVARQARWLSAQHRDSEVRPLVDTFLDRWMSWQGDRSEDARRALHVATLYAELGLNELAEEWFRKLQQFEPANYQPLASFLAHQGHWQGLLQLIQRIANAESSARPATVLARCMALGNPPQEALDAADELLREALATHPSNSGLLTAMANLRQHQGEYDAANELYKRALFLNPDDVEALSQLAHILGRKTDSTHAASAYIDRALRIAGPRAELVAIKGMTYFYKGRPEEGLDLLKVAASTAHANPKHQFYYALALAELSELDKAREVWRGIAGDELDAALSKDERQSCDSLQQLLRKP